MRYEKIWSKAFYIPILSFVLFAVGTAIWSKFGLFLAAGVMLMLSGFTFSSFSTPKFVVLATGIAGIWVGTLFGGWFGKSIEIPIFYGLAFLLILLLSFFRGMRWRITWWGTLDRMLGGVTWFWVFLYSAWVYVMVAKGCIRKHDVLFAVAVMWLVELVIYLLQHFKIAFVFPGLNPGTGRTVGSIGNPLSLNQFMFLVGAGFVEWLHYMKFGVWGEIALGALIVALIVLNFKRTTALAGIAAFFGILGYGIYVGRGELLVWFVILIVISVMVFFYWRSGIHKRLVGSVRQYWIYRRLVEKYGPEITLMVMGPSFTRPYIWLSGLRLWLTSPVWGYGFEQIRRYLMEVRHPYTYYAEHQKGYDRVHNWFLDLLIEGGIVWFLIVGWWLMVGVLAFSSVVALFLLVGYFLHLMFLFVEISAMTVWAMIFALGTLRIGLHTITIPTWIMVLAVPIAVLSLIRELSDVYAGYGRAMRQESLSRSREAFLSSVRVFPFQDEYITRLMETDVVMLRAAEGTGNISPQLVKEIVSEILEFEPHVSITNYPDTVLGYLGYSYGWLYRLGCAECKQKVFEMFDASLSVNPYNEEVVSLYANFLGNIGDWKKTADVLVGYLRRKLGSENLTDVCERLHDLVREYLQLVGSKSSIDRYLAVLAKIRPGWIGENIFKMAVFAAVKAGDKELARTLLELYGCFYVDRDEYFYDEMFVAIKSLK